MKDVRNELRRIRKCRKVQEDCSVDVEVNVDGADHPVYEKPVREADEGGVGVADEGGVGVTEEGAVGLAEEGVVGEVLEEHAAKVDEGGVVEVHEEPAAEVDEVGVIEIGEIRDAVVDDGGVGEVHELHGFVVDEGGVGEVPEEVAAPVDEGRVGEVPEQPVAEVPEQPVAEVDEGRVCEVDVGEGVSEPENEEGEEPLCVQHYDPPAVIDIGEDEEGDVIVEPMSVRPLRTYVGDPRTQVDFDKLYNSVTAKGIKRSFIAEIFGQPLSTNECESLGPRQYVDNLVVFFASSIFMYFEKRLSGVVKRIVFSPVFGNHMRYDYRRRPSNQHVWQLKDYETYFPVDLIELSDILSANLVSNL
ncbi:hypothetical protein LR48_Vigan2378s000100 [Vigna angularis]|uniref:Uncharacterized protein n=1 Tax=Vigna angularis var. angularis TaxID=157739 RepID=A0A0S3T8L0_PHAAN|nr:uncharacterized protein LOC108318711 [Vigna angularis]KOM24636.1 hypothetical protein LR48_Vigan2378s000100 [Vigna angularis]BAU01513.1 hypothetical protein VIGAN_11076200 [Vigna angularis var. angularis]